MALIPDWSLRTGLEGLNIPWHLAPPCSSSLLDVTWAQCIYCSAVIMAAWLCRSVMQRNVIWLLPCTASTARISSRGVGSTSSDLRTPSAIREKPRTVDDLPHVSLLEMFYRLVFQGFYNRLHELQVWQTERSSVWSVDAQDGNI